MVSRREGSSYRTLLDWSKELEVTTGRGRRVWLVGIVVGIWFSRREEEVVNIVIKVYKDRNVFFREDDGGVRSRSDRGIVRIVQNFIAFAACLVSEHFVSDWELPFLRVQDARPPVWLHWRPDHAPLGPEVYMCDHGKLRRWSAAEPAGDL
jgi:hypothetical protein